MALAAVRRSDRMSVEAALNMDAVHTEALFIAI